MTRLFCFLPFLSLLGIGACADQQPAQPHQPLDSQKITIVLKDSLGQVDCFIPERYDTSFVWTNQSDCGKPCDREQYRYQPKTMPVALESGFVYIIPPIQKDQFTVRHSGDFPFHHGLDTAKDLASLGAFMDRLSYNWHNGHNVFDTAEMIHDRYFYITCRKGYDSSAQLHIAKVGALTHIKGNEIEFHYDRISKDTINEKVFFDQSLEYVRSIRLSVGY